MSPEELTQWKLDAEDSFKQALVENDYNLASDIIKDMKEKGIDTKELEEDYKVACIEIDYSA